jgi:hypothetical protein
MMGESDRAHIGEDKRTSKIWQVMTYMAFWIC